MSDPPKKGEHYWTMTVDGNELKRSVDDDRLVDSLANVQCKWNLPNPTCEVTHVGGLYDAEICFELEMTCDDGSLSTAKGCETMSPTESRTKTLSKSDFSGASSCKAKSAKVNDVRIKSTP